MSTTKKLRQASAVNMATRMSVKLEMMGATYSDGRLLCIDKDKSIKEETGAYDPSVYSSIVISLSGDSSVVSIVDIDGNTVWSKKV